MSRIFVLHIGMEEFLSNLKEYSSAHGVSPSTIIQRACVGNGSTWGRWDSGAGSPTLATVDRLDAYMAENPPPKEAQDA